MSPHHEKALADIVADYKEDKTVIALLLTGSLAHGTAREFSDIDLTIIVAEEEFQQRKDANNLTHWQDLSDYYQGGYLDVKFTSIEFLQKVAQHGSEPARYAFLDCNILFDHSNNIASLIDSVTKYPTEEKAMNIKRFHAQLEAWNWYCGEAIKHDNAYLLGHSVSNLILFGGRIVLALNEILYPYHKWFINTLTNAPIKPPHFIDNINSLLINKSEQDIHHFYSSIKQLLDDIELDENWPQQFMEDSELNWLNGFPPVPDL